MKGRKPTTDHVALPVSYCITCSFCFRNVSILFGRQMLIWGLLCGSHPLVLQCATYVVVSILGPELTCVGGEDHNPELFLFLLTFYAVAHLFILNHSESLGFTSVFYGASVEFSV